MKLTPRLIAISGSLKETTFALTQDETSIGRDVSNTIALNDPSVSRRHCRINTNGGTDSFHIVDLESYNGTFVNGVPVAKQPLNHGDYIALGDLRFIFLTHDEPATAVSLQDDDLVSRSTIRLERDPAFCAPPDAVSELDHQMIGESEPMRKVYDLLSRVAPIPSTVLLLGESGTGKELAARALHRNSPRADKPLVAINCATLVESLLESELFGHEKGAFTGAIYQKRGKLELAEGGTIFFDEVGELSPAIQAKLLRVLEEREFERVGGTQTIKVDVRVIAATNRNLKAEMKAGKFREDLYYRLNVVSIPMPTLRERREDIPLLATYFVAEYSKKCKRRVTGISPKARRLLSGYDWPGNVRELQNAIERAVALGKTDLIMPEDLPETILESQASTDQRLLGYHEMVKEYKRQLIAKVLQETGGNITEAARRLGIHPNNLHRLIRELKVHDLDSPPDNQDKD
jgi:transcriptional regulator with GAF, ATPase, and Fis domain